MLPSDSKIGQLPSAGVSGVKDSILNQNSLNSIKAMGREKDPQAMRELSKKFEAMFVSQMLKTMREANDVFAQDSYFDSSEQNFHREMMDQQLVLNLTAGRGMGLADQFYRNMMRDYGQKLDLDGTSKSQDSTSQDITQLHRVQSALPLGLQKTAALADQDSAALDQFLNAYYPAEQIQSTGNAQVYLNGGKTSVTPSQQSFIAAIRPHAEAAAKQLNVSPEAIMAQAALETGWGKHVIHTQQGQNSFNLFNIKAGGSWQGDSIKVSTVEYQGGSAKTERAEFRKYNSYAESFADYVQLLQNNDRYKSALAAPDGVEFAQALQDAGYATDPKYANKICEILASDLFKSDTQNSADFVNLASAKSTQLVE